MFQRTKKPIERRSCTFMHELEVRCCLLRRRMGVHVCIVMVQGTTGYCGFLVWFILADGNWDETGGE